MPMLARPKKRSDADDREYPGTVEQYLRKRMDRYLENRALSGHEHPNITRNELIRAGKKEADISPSRTERLLDTKGNLVAGILYHLEKPDANGRMTLKEDFVQGAYQHALLRMIEEKGRENGDKTQEIAISPEELSDFIADDVGGRAPKMDANGRDPRIAQAEQACVLLGKENGMRYDEESRTLTVNTDGIEYAAKIVQPDIERRDFEPYLRNADENERIFWDERAKETEKEEPAEEMTPKSEADQEPDAPEPEQEEPAPEMEQPEEEAEPATPEEEPEQTETKAGPEAPLAGTERQSIRRILRRGGYGGSGRPGLPDAPNDYDER